MGIYLNEIEMCFLQYLFMLFVFCIRGLSDMYISRCLHLIYIYIYVCI